MTTTRLDKREQAADGAQLDRTYCHNDSDTARHVLLQCQALEGPRNEMLGLVLAIWDRDQQNESTDT